MSELVTLLGYLNVGVFAFTAFNWLIAFEHAGRGEQAGSFWWSLDAPFDERRFTLDGRKYRKRFVRGMGCFFGILVLVLVLELLPSLGA